MLGEELRRRREALGISLLDISESTRIGQRFLKAIEAENYSSLPGGIFTRSFIRAYAKRVGMDEDEALALYHQETDAAEAPQPDPVATDLAPDLATDSTGFLYEKPSHGLLSTMLVAAVVGVILVMGGWAIWHYLNRPAAAPGAAESAPQQATAPASTPAAPAATEPAAAPQATALKLEIEALDDCWMRFAVDGAESDQTTLKKGESRTFDAQKSIDLNVAFVQSVRMRLNGRDAGFPEGKKRILVTPETVGEFAR